MCFHVTDCSSTVARAGGLTGVAIQSIVFLFLFSPAPCVLSQEEAALAGQLTEDALNQALCDLAAARAELGVVREALDQARQDVRRQAATLRQEADVLQQQRDDAMERLVSAAFRAEP